MYESLGTQVLHSTGNVGHELHQHLSGQKLRGGGGGGKAERRSGQKGHRRASLLSPPSLLL